MKQFTPSEIRKRNAVLVGIHAGSSMQFQIFNLGVNLRTTQRIRKVLDDSSGDSDSTAARKSHSDHSDLNGTLKFVCEIQTMVDNDSSKSIRSITKDMEVLEFLIRQVVHEDIQYFLYKMRKGQFLSKDMKDKRKGHNVKLFFKL